MEMVNSENAWTESGSSPPEGTEHQGRMLNGRSASELTFGSDDDLMAARTYVLFIDDVAKTLRTSRSTIERRRRAGTFRIPELPSLDKRPRWSRQAVERYLASTNEGMRPRRGRGRVN